MFSFFLFDVIGSAIGICSTPASHSTDIRCTGKAPHPVQHRTTSFLKESSCMNTKKRDRHHPMSVPLAAVTVCTLFDATPINTSLRQTAGATHAHVHHGDTARHVVCLPSSIQCLSTWCIIVYISQLVNRFFQLFLSQRHFFCNRMWQGTASLALISADGRILPAGPVPRSRRPPGIRPGLPPPQQSASHG